MSRFRVGPEEDEEEPVDSAMPATAEEQETRELQESVIMLRLKDNRFVIWQHIIAAFELYIAQKALSSCLADWAVVLIMYNLSCCNFLVDHWQLLCSIVERQQPCSIPSEAIK